MPLIKVGRKGWKFGNKGKVYRGKAGRALALRQGRAIEASKAKRGK